MNKTHYITLIPGDGIGPEVVHAARRIIEAAGVSVAWEEAHAGASMFRKGVAARRRGNGRVMTFGSWGGLLLLP